MAAGETRYSRQVRFAPLGEEGQRRIASAHVAIVGCGALGAVHAEVLARSGVGQLRLIDRDFVEWSNLQRQSLFDEADAAAALPKAVAAAKRLAHINSGIAVEPVVADFTPSNVAELLEGIDLILDGTDNFETRYLLNDAAVERGIPWIYGAAVGSYGIKMAIVPGQTACLRCVYPESPRGAQPTCETDGVLAPVTAAIAALQAGDALKILARGAESIEARLTMVDVWTGEIRQTRAALARSGVPVLRAARIFLSGRQTSRAHQSLRPQCGPDPRTGPPGGSGRLTRRLSALAPVRSNEFALRVMLDPYELTVFPDGRAIIKGTTDVGVARSIYARYVGA